MSKGTIRLNDEHRNTIISNALNGRFVNEIKKINEDKEILVRDLYAKIVSKKEREALELLGNKWTNKLHVDYISYVLSNESVGRLNVAPLRESTPLCKSNRYCGYNYYRDGVEEEFKNFVIISSSYPYRVTDPELEARLIALQERIDEVNKEYKNIYNSLTALVNSVRTIGGLFRVWPQGAAYYNDIEDVGERLPSPMIAELNKALGL